MRTYLYGAAALALAACGGSLEPFPGSPADSAPSAVPEALPPPPPPFGDGGTTDPPDAAPPSTGQPDAAIDAAPDAGAGDDASDAGPPAVVEAAPPPALDTCPTSEPNLEPRNASFKLADHETSCYVYGAAPQSTDNPVMCCVTVCPLTAAALKALECAICQTVSVPGRTEIYTVALCPEQGGAAQTILTCDDTTITWCRS